MSPDLFEPRRLRENPERPTEIEGRLARQLRVLSVYAPTPQLRRYSRSPRRQRSILSAVRVALVATVALAVSGVAAAMATYVVRRVWSSPAVVEPTRRPAPLPPTRRHETGATSRPVVPDVDVSAVARASVSAAFHDEVPGLPRPVWRPLLAKRSGGPAPEPRPSPEVPRPAAAAPTFHPPAPPSPTGVSPFGSSPGAAWPTPLLPGDPVPNPTPSEPLRSVVSLFAPNNRVEAQVTADGATQEAGLLRQALAALRRDHDGKRALALLDDYDRRFGPGTLALEAISTRAQALLQQGDTQRALELLDRLPLSQNAYPGELRIIRGELRSLSNRCREALADFDEVLRATRGSPAEIARALFGRASCRARTGDPDGAESDRQRYLKEFPHGPAARQLMSRP